MCETPKLFQLDTSLKVAKQTSDSLHYSKTIILAGDSIEINDLLIFSAIILLTIFVYFLFKKTVKKKAINKARFFVVYLVLALLAILILLGKHYIPSAYYANIVTEVIGIALTVIIIDRVNYYLTNRNEKLFRDIALRHCKMPIYSYCFMWFAIYEPNQIRRQNRLQKYSSLEAFLLSDDFYKSVCKFNFATNIGSNKTYAQYYSEQIVKTEDSFQNIFCIFISYFFALTSGVNTFSIVE